MAEFTAFRNNALPYPVYGLPYVVQVPLLDADGDPVSPSAPDSEISKNGDTAVDCTNELVEISGITGGCYLSLTATELTADAVYLECASTGAKTTHMTLYPRKLVTVRTGTSASGGVSTSTVVLDASASAVDDYYNGMIVAVVIDGTIEVRMISDYTGSSQTATVVPDFTVAPDNNDAFTIYRPEGTQQVQSDVRAYGGVGGTFSGGRPEVNTTHAAGTAWNSAAIGAATLASDTIAAAKIAAGAITAAKFAADAIDAAAVAASAITEIQSGLSTLDAAGVRTAVGLASANLDTQLDALPTAAENAAAALTTQMTESYNADGAAPTLAQAAFVIMQRLTEFAIAGTTVTVKKLNGTTTALTLTLDSDTAPTSSTRAT